MCTCNYSSSAIWYVLKLCVTVQRIDAVIPCGSCVGRVDSRGWKCEDSSGYQSVAGGHSSSSEQGVAGRSASDGICGSPMLCPHPGSLHDSSGDIDKEQLTWLICMCLLAVSYVMLFVAETWTWIYFICHSTWWIIVPVV